uniref:Uncharacterized protein n=1 Tax=Romanomermis culicivorax TaxID=13658 RepID=A0A915HWD3_ROMCU
MYNCALSDCGPSFCLGTEPKGFRDVKTLTWTIHQKLITLLEMPKKKKKKSKCNKWNQSPELSDDEDPSLIPSLA